MLKKKTMTTIFVVLLSLGVIVVFLPNIMAISSVSEVNKCRSIVNSIKARIKDNLGREDYIIYCSPGVKGIIVDNLPEVSIYDFADTKDIDLIINLLREIDKKPFKIAFYEKENIKIMKDSSGKVVGKRRESETKLEQVTIK